MEKIYVVIPSYRPAVSGFSALTKQICDRGYTLVAVDDCARDAGTAPTVQPDERMILLHHDRHRGRGAAVRTGLSYIQDSLIPADFPDECRENRHLCAGNALVAIMASDSLFGADDLELLLDAARRLENRNRLVVGVRHPEKRRSFVQRTWNGLLHGLFRLLVRARVPYDMTGFRVCDASCLPEILELEGEHADYELRQFRWFSRNGEGLCEVNIKGKNSPARTNRHIFLDSVRLHLRTIRFTGSSMISSLLEYGIFCLLHYLLCGEMPRMGDALAVVISRIIGNGCNYLINCYFVFRRKPDRKSVLQFAVLTGASIGLCSVMLYLWKLTGWPVPLCKILADLCVFIVSYFVQKQFIFRKKQKAGHKSPENR